MAKTPTPKTTTLVATLTTPPAADGAEIASLPASVGFLEVRADLVGDLDPDWLRDRFRGGLLYTLRSVAEGGACEAGRAARQRRLLTAAERYDLVDLEAERDLAPALLDGLPAERRLLSWHGPTPPLSQLKGRCETMAQTPARFYKLIPTARQEEEALRPLALLHDLGRDDVVAFAAGDCGVFTRLLAPRLGSPLVYGSLGEVPGAPGQLSVARLINDFGLPALPPVERLYGVVGRPVSHSLSPRLHNGAYRELGVPALYLPFHAESFGDFWLEIVEAGHLDRLGFPLRGLSVTAPYKEAALAVAGASSPRADHVGGANTLVWNEEVWEGEATDPEGVVLALEGAGVEPVGARVAVVGCGGAGRAAAYGLQLAGAEVTLVNRTVERGEQAARELRLPFTPLAAFAPAGFDVVVQATSLGRGADDPLPFDPARLAPDAALVDLVYGDGPTPLERAARAAGRKTVGGRAVLLHQALRQFQLMTGRELDPGLARRVLAPWGDGE